MLIGLNVNKPNIKRVRALKQVLREVLQLSDDTVVTITQLTCLESDCQPIETVFGLLRVGMPNLQSKIHKEIQCINPSDLQGVSSEWGFNIDKLQFEQLFKAFIAQEKK